MAAVAGELVCPSDRMIKNPLRRKGPSIWGLVEAAAALLGAATIVSFLGRTWWVFELTTHFPLHLGVALGLIALFAAIKRRWRMTVVCGALAAVNLIKVATLLFPPATAAPAGITPFQLVSLNVHTANERSDLVLEYLRQTDADVILLMEVDERWMGALAALDGKYPHQIAEPREDNFGIALFSRLPLTNAQVLNWGDVEVPSLSAELHVGESAVLLLGTHPLPPGSAADARLRNEQFRNLAAHVREQQLPVVVLGDLNATPSSPYFAQLLRESDLRSASQGRGLLGTWPAGLPVGRIPLDHCLVSRTIHVAQLRVGAAVGSDHLPLVVELALPPK